ncbi:MAG: AI-2E family transporter [Chloroflexi bacterium]|nr:AI-2E family transporter [Chloroflexota bacterium]
MPPATWLYAILAAAVALILGLGLLRALVQLSHVLGLLLAAIVLADAIAPLVSVLERFVPRTLAILLVYLCGIVAVGLIAWLIVPTIIAEGVSLLANVPRWIARAESLLNHLSQWQGAALQPILEHLQTNVSGLTGLLFSLPLTIVSSTVDIVFLIVTSIYWSLTSPALRRFILSLFAPEQQGTADTVLREMGQNMGGYVRGILIDGLAIGVASYIGMLAIGLDFPLVLGIIAGLGEMVPLVGATVGAIPSVIVAFLKSPMTALIVIAFYVVLQQAENHLLVPNVMSREADIPPVLAIIALLAGAALGGLLGALIAIPAAGALQVLVLRVLAPAIRNWTGAQAPCTPAGDAPGADAPGADAPGADAPGADAPGADAPGVDAGTLGTRPQRRG